MIVTFESANDKGYDDQLRYFGLGWDSLDKQFAVMVWKWALVIQFGSR